jgi:hypothetical protein
MFIEPLLRTIRAPAERNVSGDEWESEYISLCWSEKESFEGRGSINITPLRGVGTLAGKILLRKREVRTLYYRLRTNRKSKFASILRSA